MQLHQRLSRGLISSFAARGVAIVSQLVSVPILARTWGVEVYGQYLTMVALAAYVSLATLGVHQAALAEMAIGHARNDAKAYGNAMRGLFQVVVGVSGAALSVQIILAFLAPTAAILHQNGAIVGAVHYSAPWAIFLIGLQAILLQNIGVVTNAIAALGRYGEAQAYDTFRTGVDSCALWVAVIGFHLGPDKAALVSVAISSTVLLLAWRRLGKVAPERLRLLSAVDWRTFARLWKPTMGNFAIGTLFQTLLVQAPRLILASVAGGAAVALFSIIWALMGVIRQSFEVLIHPLNVEFAFAFGSNEKSLATDLLAIGTTTATALTALACAPVIVLGPWIIGLATKGQIHAPHLMIAMLWGVLALYSSSICFQAALQSSNQSHHTVWPLLWQSGIFIVGAIVLARVAGPYGLAAALLGYQFSVSAVVVKWTCRAFDIRFVDVFREATSLRSIRRMGQMVLGPILKTRNA
jgi:O-antigen/teichoic acid export membrane protein